MDFLRRLTLLLYGLALLALVTVVLLFPEGVAGALQSLANVDATLRAGVAVVVGFVILIALYMIVRAPRYDNRDGLIVKTPGALADVSITSARERILKAVLAVPNVISADVKLQALQGKADIDLAVEVAGTNINVPNKQKEIDKALRQITLKQLGLQLATRPRVHIQLLTEEELREREASERAAVLPPAPPPAAPVAASWNPPPPPETRSVTPVVAAPAVVAAVPEPAPAPPEPVAPAADEEPLPIEVEPTPIWDEPILPPEEASPSSVEPSADDLVLEALPEVDLEEPEWLTSEPGDGLLVNEDTDNVTPVEALSNHDETLMVPPMDFVVADSDAPAPEPTADIHADVEADLDAAVITPEPAPPAEAGDLDVPPLSHVDSPDDAPAPEPTADIDPAALGDEADNFDWLTALSSPDEESGLYEEDEARSQRGRNGSPPLPDLD